MTPRGFRSARLLTAGTSLRIVAVPAIMALVLAGGTTAETIAVALFAAAALTDFFDGYLARRWKVTTPLGSFLDTTADKLLVTGVLVALVDVDRTSVWLAALIIGREITILGLKGVVAADGDVVQPSMLGKWKAAIQFVAIGLAILRPGDPVAGLYVDEWAMLIATVVTVVSAIDYIVRLSSADPGGRPPRPAPPRGDADRPGPGASGPQVPLGGRPSPSP
ncbi:MAG TPA: CDP-diacylglycerol--glycerol-3-phosphate 3-phosphatidyltransferase [Solirubrobacteraceae bacterium]|nr:CDP-diacylglycerol--glycerol-3-phosphate 3-phosphatidyltransferase [Solirubrobacteraceae bacterium]